MVDIKKQRLFGSFIPNRMPFDLIDSLKSSVIKLTNFLGFKQVPRLAFEFIVEKQNVERMDEVDKSVSSVSVLHKIKRQVKTIKFSFEFLQFLQ
jgi:hypothetical protein